MSHDRTTSRYRHTTRRVIEDPLFGSQPIAGIGAATGMAQSAASTAAQTGGAYGTSAADINQFIVPTLMGDVRNPQGYDQATLNNMLGMGLGTAGGAASGIVGQAGLQAARSRNVGAATGVMDEAAREKMRTSAGVGLDVATKNAEVQQQQRQQALQQLQGLYGTDVGAQLKAQSLVPEDINAWANANQTGWVQNVDQTIGALGSAASGAALSKMAWGCWVAAELYGGWTKPEVLQIRQWLQRNWYMQPFTWIYARFGERWAEYIREHRTARKLTKKLFDFFLRLSHG